MHPPTFSRTLLLMYSLGNHAFSSKALIIYGIRNGVDNALAALFADSGFLVHIDSLIHPTHVLVNSFDEQPSATNVVVVHALQHCSFFATVMSTPSIAKI